MSGEEILKDLKGRAADVESRYAVSTWLKAEASCGETSYPNCKTNVGWCTNEVMRLKGIGVTARIVRLGQDVAVFKTPSDEVALEIEDVYRRINDIMKGAA